MPMHDPVTGAGMRVSADGSIGNLGYPVGATLVTASATGTTAAVAATLPGVAGKTTYITGFQVTQKNPTAAVDITVTTTGLATNMSWNMSLLATAATVLHPAPLTVLFDPPMPASGANAAIVVTAGAAGAGGLASVNVQGYQL